VLRASLVSAGLDLFVESACVVARGTGLTVSPMPVRRRPTVSHPTIRICRIVREKLVEPAL
jgi:hypothetical protein